jgi:hypothetical protein
MANLVEFDLVRHRWRKPGAPHHADFAANQGQLRDVLRQADKIVHMWLPHVSSVDHLGTNFPAASRRHLSVYRADFGSQRKSWIIGRNSWGGVAGGWLPVVPSISASVLFQQLATRN